MIGAPWSVDPQPKRLDHRRPENIGFEATLEFLGCRVGTGSSPMRYQRRRPARALGFPHVQPGAEGPASPWDKPEMF